MHLNMVKFVKHSSLYVSTGADIFNKCSMGAERQTHILEKNCQGAVQVQRASLRSIKRFF